MIVQGKKEEGMKLPPCSDFYHSFNIDMRRIGNMFFVEKRKLVSAVGNILVFIDVDTGKCEFLQSKGDDGIGSICVYEENESQTFIAVGCIGKKPSIFIYEYPSLKIVKECIRGSVTETKYTALCFDKRGEKLAAVGYKNDYMLTIWDWRKESIILRYKAFGQEIFKVSFSPFLKGHLTTSGIGHIRFWKMAQTFTGLKLRGEVGKFGKVNISDIVGFSQFPDGKVLSGSEQGHLILWEENLVKVIFYEEVGEVIDHRGRKIQKNKPCHEGMITRVQLLDDGSGEKIIMTTGVDGFIKFWDFDTIDTAERSDQVNVSTTQSENQRRKRGEDDDDEENDLSPLDSPLSSHQQQQQEKLMDVSMDGNGHEEDKEGRKFDKEGETKDEDDNNQNLDEIDVSYIFKIQPIGVLNISEHHNGQEVRIVNVVSREQTWVVQDENGTIWRIDQSPSPSPSLTISSENATSIPVKSFLSGNIGALDTCPFEHLCVVGCDDGRVRLVDYLHKKELYDRRFNCGVSFVTWIPSSVDESGRTILCGFSNGVLRHLGICKDGFKLCYAVKPHKGKITSIGFSKDGRLLFTGSEDGTVFFFRVLSKEEKEEKTTSQQKKNEPISPFEIIGFVKFKSEVTKCRWIQHDDDQFKGILTTFTNGDVFLIDPPDYSSSSPSSSASFTPRKGKKKRKQTYRIFLRYRKYMYVQHLKPSDRKPKMKKKLDEQGFEVRNSKGEVEMVVDEEAEAEEKKNEMDRLSYVDRVNDGLMLTEGALYLSVDRPEGFYRYGGIRWKEVSVEKQLIQYEDEEEKKREENSGELLDEDSEEEGHHEEKETKEIVGTTIVVDTSSEIAGKIRKTPRGKKKRKKKSGGGGIRGKKKKKKNSIPKTLQYYIQVQKVDFPYKQMTFNDDISSPSIREEKIQEKKEEEEENEGEEQQEKKRTFFSSDDEILKADSIVEWKKRGSICTCLSVSKRGSYLICGYRSGKVRLISTQGERNRRTIDLHVDDVTALCSSFDESFFLSVSKDSCFFIQRIKDQETIEEGKKDFELEKFSKDCMEDILDVNAWSIEESRIKVAEEALRKKQHLTQEDRRLKVKELKKKYLQLLKKNKNRISRKELQLDPDLEEKLKQTYEEKVSECYKKFAFDTEKAELGRKKLEDFFFGDLEFERVMLYGFFNDIGLSSFQTRKIHSTLQKELNEIHNIVNQERRRREQHKRFIHQNGGRSGRRRDLMNGDDDDDDDYDDDEEYDNDDNNKSPIQLGKLRIHPHPEVGARRRMNDGNKGNGGNNNTSSSESTESTPSKRRNQPIMTTSPVISANITFPKSSTTSSPSSSTSSSGRNSGPNGVGGSGRSSRSSSIIRSRDESSLKKVEEFRKSREQQELSRTRLMEMKNKLNETDPILKQEIEKVKNDIGTYPLKMSPEYEVSESNRETTKKKITQMVLLEESQFKLRCRFNERFFALRELKMKLLDKFKKYNIEIHRINEELGLSDNNEEDEEMRRIGKSENMKKEEIPELLRHRISERDLKKFKEYKKQMELSRSFRERQEEEEGIVDIMNIPSKQQHQQQELEGGEDETTTTTTTTMAKDNINDDAISVTTNRTRGGGNNNKYLRHRFATTKKKKTGRDLILESLPRSSMEFEFMNIYRKKRLFEKKRLLNRKKMLMTEFDKSLEELRIERFKLCADLKQSDLKLLLLYHEFELLKGYEEKDRTHTMEKRKIQEEKNKILMEIKTIQDDLIQKNIQVKAMQSKESVEKKLEMYLQQHREELLDGKSSTSTPPKQQQQQEKNKGNDHNENGEEGEEREEDIIEKPEGLKEPDSSEEMLQYLKEEVYGKRRKYQKDSYDGEDSDDEFSDSDDEFDNDDDLHNEDSSNDRFYRPIYCPVHIFNEVLTLRKEKMNQEEEIEKIRKGLKSLKEHRKELDEQKKKVDKKLKHINEEISKVQKLKQNELNELRMVVFLKTHQIRSLVQRKIPMNLKNHVIFNVKGLNDLWNKEKQVKLLKKRTISQNKKYYQNLKKIRSEIKEVENELIDKKKEVLDFQLLKFGQKVNYEDLILTTDEQAEQYKTILGEEELTTEKMLKKLHQKINKKKEELAMVTQQNTRLLTQLASLREKQESIQKELNNAQESMIERINKGSDMASKGKTRLRKLKRVAIEKGREIQKFKNEIGILRSKSSRVYTQ